MPKGSLRYFWIFLILSLLLFALSRYNLLETPSSYLTKAVTSASAPLFLIGDFFGGIFKNDTKLKEENLALAKKLIDQEKLLSENKALHDQFQIEKPRSLDLLPAGIVSSPRFIPGIFSPEFLVIDKGTDEGIKVGNGVVFKNNLVGKVTKTSKFLSQVTLLTNPNLKFAAKTEKGTFGVLKGEGNGDIFLDNVLLSDHLSKGELVVTSGDLKIDQTGFPPDLIIGKIVSVSSNPSDLFQRAKLQTLVDFSSLTKVFIIKGLK